MKWIRFVLILPVVSLFTSHGEAQTISEETTDYDSALFHTVSLYYRHMGDQSKLFNGNLYTGYTYSFKTGNPYFPPYDFVTGSLVYDGMRFDTVSLLYEDLRQMVVTKKEGYPLQLVNDKVSSFTISGHSFIHRNLEGGEGLPFTGFYEVIYNGPSQILKETSKSIQTQANIYEGLIRSIEEKNEYYFKTSAGFKRIRSKDHFLDLMGDRKKDVQRFIKKNNLNFRKDKENTISQAAAYFDQLVH